MNENAKFVPEEMSEHEEPVDFLSRELDMTISISEEAFTHFPEVSEREIETGQEKFRILLGSYVKQLTGVNVNIDAIMELTEPYGYYHEGIEEIREINIQALKDLVKRLEDSKESQGLKMVGDLHTHPVKQSRLHPNQRSFHLSQGDIDCMISHYKDGVINANSPYVFVIAGSLEDGKTGYAYYRVIKDGDKYCVMNVHEKGQNTNNI